MSKLISYQFRESNMQIDSAAASGSGHITGKNKGSVTEDGRGYFASGVLSVKGAPDDSFQSSLQPGIYGTLRMGVEENGRWVYVLDNSLATTQALDKGDRVLESFVVQTAGGTLSETITIVVRGAAEASSAAAVHESHFAQGPGHLADWADFISLVGLPQA